MINLEYCLRDAKFTHEVKEELRIRARYQPMIDDLESGLYDGLPEYVEWFNSLTHGQRCILVLFVKKYSKLF